MSNPRWTCDTLDGRSLRGVKAADARSGLVKSLLVDSDSPFRRIVFTGPGLVVQRSNLVKTVDSCLWCLVFSSSTRFSAVSGAIPCAPSSLKKNPLVTSEGKP
ncbi:unnamed protein product [Ascophyllum nodosum]